MEFASTLVTPPPAPVEKTRRVVIELPESRALAFSRALNEHVEWASTEACEEFEALHEALGADWRKAGEAARNNTDALTF